MNDPHRTYDHLRAANPAPLTPVVDRPSAAEFLATLDTRQPAVTPPTRSGPSRSRAVRVAAVAFAITLVLGFSFWLTGRLALDDDVVEPSITTTQIPEVTTTTSAPSVIDPAAQAWLDRFQATFNAGDADAFLALFPVDFNREVVVDSDRRLLSLDSMRELYLVEAALKTEIDLECTVVGDLYSCIPFRYDDLHRALGVGPTEGYAWNLRFAEGGLIRAWNEGRINVRGADDYEREVIGPFMAWVRENHPEVGELNPAVAGDWIVEKRDDIVAMVAAFAESRGVTLGE